MRIVAICLLLLASGIAHSEGWVLYYGEEEDKEILRAAAAVQANKCIQELKTCSAKTDRAEAMPKGIVAPDCFVGRHAGKPQYVCVHPFSVEYGSCGDENAAKRTWNWAIDVYKAFDQKSKLDMSTSCCVTKTCLNDDMVGEGDE